MLQKLLIASFATLALTACSGSDSTSTETLNEAPPAPSTDNPQEPEEPVGPEVFASMTFGSEASVDSWQVRCADAGNCDADLSHSAEEGVLVVTPTWVTDSDNLEVYTALDPAIGDLTSGTVEFDVRVTEDYLTDGNLRLQLFIENAAGGAAYTGWATPETEYENEEGDIVSTNGWTQFKFENLQMNSFSFTDDSFTLENINTIGVQFVANGKPASVGGDLWIDNVRITGPAGDAPEPAEINPDFDDPNWTSWDAGDLTVTQTESGVSFSPTEGNQKFGYLAQGPLDLTGQSFTIEYSVDQDFIESGADLQPFAQTNFGGYSGHWGCYIGNGDLPAAGETGTFTCSDLPDTIVSDAEGNNIRVGFQIVGAAAGTVTIEDLIISLPASEPAPTEIVPELTTDNFQIFDGTTETMTVSDAGISFEPATANAKFAYVLQGPFDLGGESFTITYTVDQAYIDGGGDLQPFAQNNYTGYAGHRGCYISNADLEADIATEYVCDGIDAAIVAGEDQGIRVGLQVTGTGGTVTINELVIPIP